MKKKITRHIKTLLQFIFPTSFVFGRIKELNGIVLTFDDGPHPVHTPRILDILKKRNIQVVFFVTGSELAKFPALGEKIVADGHLLGNHVYDHMGVDECTFREYQLSIEKADNLINNIDSLEKAKLFRPPYSKISIKLLFFILFSKYTLFNWTIDSLDSFIHSKEELLDYCQKLSIVNGDILLFHEDYEHTVSALPKLLDYFQESGFVFRLP